MRVAIIGAGPSGITAMAAFQELKNKGQECPEVVVFERQEEIGGLWNYNWRTGVDKDGYSCHNSMYKHLWSNGPKECIEFPDYTFEQHFGEPTCSYPPRLALRDYIMGYAKNAKINHEWIRCNTMVKNVVFNEESKRFEITAQDLASEYKEIFDHVIVSTGHFSVPVMPEFAGLGDYAGLTMHSHDFRAAEAFKGQTVVVVGKSCSAEDVASQLHKYGAKRVIITHRKADEAGKWQPTGFHWSEGIEEKALMKSFKGNSVTFGDDSTVEADAIILCTGYKHWFPFLDKKIKLECENTMWLPELNMSIQSKQCPNLYFLSMQDQYYTYNMFAGMAYYARDCILGKLSTATPLKDSDGKEWSDAAFVQLFKDMATDADMYGLQGKFTECLMEVTGYGKDAVNPKAFTAGINKTFDDWEELKHHNIMNYRDHAHASLVTGTMSPKPSADKAWLNNKWEDDIEFYKNMHKQ